MVCAQAFGAVGVVVPLFLQLVGHHDRQQLVACDDVAFLDQQLLDAAAYLGTDDDFISGDDARQVSSVGGWLV